MRGDASADLAVHELRRHGSGRRARLLLDGRPHPARRRSDAALRLAPSNVLAHFRRGNAYLAQNRYDEALSDFDATIRVKPDYAEVYVNRSFAYYKTGQFDRDRLAS